MTYQFSKVSTDKLSPENIEQWDGLLTGSTNLYKMYQSPQWWQHLLEDGNPNDFDLILAQDQEGRQIGIIPTKKSKIRINISLKRREYSISSFSCLEVLGSQLLLPTLPELYTSFFQWVWANYPDCDGVYLKSLPQGSFGWRYLEQRQWKVDGSPVYRFSKSREFYILRAADSFDDYLSVQFRKKKRYNLKRQVRMLEEAAQNEFRIETITHSEQVAEFNRQVRAISENSWKAQKLEQHIPDYVQDDADLKDAAARGLLRAYLVFVDDKPVTYVLGFQYKDVYHYSDIGFDEDFARYSPGSVLLFKLIEDLSLNTGLKFINFGIGDSEYKRQFANDSVQDNSLIVLRKSLRNRIHFGLNEMLKQGKEKLKSWLKET